MIRMNWELVLSVKPSTLTDQEIEDLFPMVVSCEVENVESIHNLKALMKLSQEMLQHKDNQVESLLLECDDLKQRIVSATSKSGSSLKRKKSEERRESLDLGTPIDEILSLTSGLASDLVNDHGDGVSLSGSSVANQKTEKIATLMSELEAMETENLTLKEKLRVVKEEMEDATKQMNRMTEELSSLKEKKAAFNDKLSERERENKALIGQIQAIAAQQLDRDNAIDEFSAAIDARITEWKVILDEKDAEIAALRENLSQSMIQSLTSVREENKSQIVHLSKVIDQRDAAIDELKKKLAQAVKEMNESTDLIEKMKADANKIERSDRRKEQRNLLKKIQESNEKITSLESILTQTENLAEIKSRELCEALAKLERYENGEYGLAEAIEELKLSKKEIGKKDEHIEELVNVINKLENINSQQEIEIASLCEKLGLSPSKAVPIDGVVAKHAEEMRKAEKLKLDNAALRNENIELKSDVRALRYELKNAVKRAENVPEEAAEEQTDYPAPAPRKISTSQSDWITEREELARRHVAEIEDIKNNVRIVVEENEALRKGMHEILDSVHGQDGSCAVEIQSETLERLLEALDVRHLAGWYHPAMRMQNRLSAIQGSNSELRSQLRQIRAELERKDEILEQILVGNDKRDRREKAIESDDSPSESGETKARESPRLGELRDYEMSDWQVEKNALYDEKTELEESIIRLEVTLEEYEKNWQILESGDDETKRALAKMTKENAERNVRVIVLERKCKVLEDLVSKESRKFNDREREAIARENELRRRLAEAEKSSKLMENKVAVVQSNLANSVSSIEHEELKERYNEVCVRLRIALDEADAPLKMVNFGAEEVEASDGKKDPSAVSKPRENPELVEFYDKFSKLIRGDCRSEIKERVIELEGEIRALEIEKEELETRARIAVEETQAYVAQNTARMFEVDSLRHQLLDLQSVSEDKETIARLGFELKNLKLLETETSKRNAQLQNEVLALRTENERMKKRVEEAQEIARESQRMCEARCRNYLELVDFLQRQYAGSTPLTALQRFEAKYKGLKSEKLSVEKSLKETLSTEEKARTTQELLSGRLQVVEQLKAILEEQIGSPNVQELIHRFSESSQSMLGELRYKRQINQLENELKTANNRVSSQEAVVNAMECEMVLMQKLWGKSCGQQRDREEKVEDCETETETVADEAVARVSVSVQTISFNRSVETQVSRERDPPPIEVAGAENRDAQIALNERLNQALYLASERSALLVKCESRIAEYEAMVVALNKQIEKKESAVKTAGENNGEPNAAPGLETSDKIVLKSTVNSLQKIVAQKEEAIVRYQKLLKEDRDEHSKAAARLQEEIKTLQARIAGMQQQVNRKINEYINPPEINPVKERKYDDRNKNIDLEEAAEKLNERVSTLEADLNIAKELGERWHRLAEERLRHMDHMRERLEEQHKNELESYRTERDKWQLEADALRKQLSDNRMQLAKGNSFLSKELQERDERINELDIAYQELQEKIKLAERQTISQQIVAHDSKMHEISENIGRAQSSQLQAQLELARRQIQTLAEKEKNHKSEIVALKQQLSRRYMAAKSHEQKISQREIQLERKTRALEEEMHTLKIELEREKYANENKKLKTAEELALWDKQKRWQQTAEKFKERFREKSEEYEKLETSNKKLRAVVSCMEREKWYLRSKLRCENGCLVGSLSARPGTLGHADVLESLQRECLTLRSRVRELTDRLEDADMEQLVMKIESQGRKISALETATKGNEYVVEQLERLEATKDVLEKNNLKLESENLELRLEIEKIVLDTPRLREKIEHLEKYIELLKVEKSSESSPRSFDNKDQENDQGKKSIAELERTVFTLKRVVEKLQAENKRLKIIAKKTPYARPGSAGSVSSLQGQYEKARQRVVALETDLQLAEQRIAMLEDSRKDEEQSGEIGVLRQQLAHKSELLDKVKQLLTRAAINEKSLRQRVQMLEAKQSLETIPECYVSPPTPDD